MTKNEPKPPFKMPVYAFWFGSVDTSLHWCIRMRIGTDCIWTSFNEELSSVYNHIISYCLCSIPLFLV